VGAFVGGAIQTMVILTNIRSNTAVVLVSGGALVALAVAFSIFITKGQPARKQASLALQAAPTRCDRRSCGPNYRLARSDQLA
jgi:hypothetical protein